MEGSVFSEPMQKCFSDIEKCIEMSVKLIKAISSNYAQKLSEKM